MKIFIINAHWHNRGDEAAIRAMVDELLASIADIEIVIHYWTNNKIVQFPYDKKNVKLIYETISRRHILKQLLGLINPRGLKKDNVFYKELSDADLVLYAPGGAAIGDYLLCDEMYYIEKMFYAKKLKKPYIFYAPSMGPFHNNWRNILRKYILNNSALLCVREPISATYLKELGVGKKVHITLDSAFQHDIDTKENLEKLLANQHLNDFMKKYDRIVGITITNLMWSSIYAEDKKLPAQIKNTFRDFVDELNIRGFGIVFIPQLFGEQNDYKYMSSFLKENCFILSDKYDCYFQQYLISKLYCVIGMRYHSNIFSAKMGTPFISISYQEKMKGFMQKVKLEKYCLDIYDLNFQSLLERFELLQTNYESYKQYLTKINNKLKQQSHRTTDLVCKYIKEKCVNNEAQ